MGKYRRWGVTAAAVFFILCVTGILFPMMFYLNDDVTMRSILSGSYTGIPDGHAVYMKYPLTGLISLLYRLIGNVPWFSLFMAGCFWLAVSMVMGHLAGITKLTGKAGVSIIVCVAFLCAALFLPQYVYLHYTIVAAMLGGCGLFLAASGGEKKAVLLFVLCYCVRSQMFFLLLPFLAVIFLWQLWENRGKQQLVMLTFLAVGILLCMTWNGVMYRSEDWKQFNAYNESRTQLYDYHDLLSYKEYSPQYESAGIGVWEYSIMEQYALALDNRVDAELLQAASDIYSVKRDSERSAAEYFKFCLIEYYYHAVYTDKPYNYILVCAYLLAVTLLLWKRRWIQLVLTCCMAAGRSLIWIYLIWQGRFPERIYISLYLLEIMVLAGMVCAILTGCHEVGRKELLRDACICALFALTLAGVCVVQMKNAVESAAAQRENQKKWNVLTAYCEKYDSNFYLLDVRSMVSYAGGVWENTSVQANYLLAGGWMSATPLLQERIHSMGVEDGGELLARGNVGDTEIFYIAAPERDMDWLSEYIGQRFGDMQVEYADSIVLDGEVLFCVYSIQNI